MIARNPGPRRAPVQQRSRARVERVLQAASELLDEQGLDAVTTRSLAERARIPVATLYQYFPNREAVLAELATRAVDRVDQELGTRLAALTATSLPEAVEQLLELHRVQYRSHPEIVALYYAHRGSGHFPDAHAHRSRMAAAVHGLLLDRGWLAPGTDVLVTEVAIESADGILELAYRRHPEGDPRTVAEATLAMTRYLEAYAPK
ncbi:TetR/AcrR family transcriptional regulator [Nocardia sp. NPDC127579]|uniref:TetR/AcrR family transcriptional regulator n=1 Tax=Nocardia sp. NPDC127579 TaxID=3345402 RepID=UPI003644541F